MLTDRPEIASGFAVANHRGGVVVFRGTPAGLRCETSGDGVKWQSAELHGAEASALEPMICASNEKGDAELYCTRADGTIRSVRAGEAVDPSTDGVFPSQADAKWYEPAARAGEVAILRASAQEPYRAFFCARRNVGRLAERRGCIGVAVSSDLRRWETRPPVFAPNRFANLYAPHVFHDNGRTMLMYATEESDGHRAIRYAATPSAEGPFESAAEDVLSRDARRSVHTVRLGTRRLIFFGRSAPGEAPSETVSRPGEVAFHAGGRPVVRFYEQLRELLGNVLFQVNTTLLSGELLVRVLPRHGRDFLLTARLSGGTAKAAGLLFRTSLTGHDNITLWLDFARGAVTLRRGVKGRILARAQRELKPGAAYRLAVWAEGEFADVFLDDEWVLSAHTEGRLSGAYGLTVSGGESRFEELKAEAISHS